MGDGYVKLYRSIQDSELWGAEPFTKAQAWIDLIFLANYKDSMFFKRGIEVNVPRGSLAWGEIALAKKWAWSKNKVRRFLEWLETKQQIEQQKSHVITVIKIVNYEGYQGNGTTNDTTERQQKVQQKDTSNKRKEKKEVKEEEENTYIVEIVDYLNDATGKNFKSSSKKTAGLIKARMKDGFSVSDIRLVIDKKVSAWGDDEKMSEYLRPETLFGPKFESYLNAKAKDESMEDKLNKIFGDDKVIDAEVVA